MFAGALFGGDVVSYADKMYALQMAFNEKARGWQEASTRSLREFLDKEKQLEQEWAVRPGEKIVLSDRPGRDPGQFDDDDFWELGRARFKYR